MTYQIELENHLKAMIKDNDRLEKELKYNKDIVEEFDIIIKKSNNRFKIMFGIIVCLVLFIIYN